MRLGRNDPCHCGSGKTYKVCHLSGALDWVAGQRGARAGSRKPPARRRSR